MVVVLPLPRLDWMAANAMNKNDAVGVSQRVFKENKPMSTHSTAGSMYPSGSYKSVRPTGFMVSSRAFILLLVKRYHLTHKHVANFHSRRADRGRGATIILEACTAV